MNGVIFLEFLRTERNLVDHFTKGLSKKLVLEFFGGMGLKPV